VKVAQQHTNSLPDNSSSSNNSNHHQKMLQSSHSQLQNTLPLAFQVFHCQPQVVEAAAAEVTAEISLHLQEKRKRNESSAERNILYYFSSPLPFFDSSPVIP
jgi:hypothetical protein